MKLLQPIILRQQFALAKRAGLLDLLQAAAQEHDLPLHFVLAVASRETGIRNIAGDGGHGRGVMQVDDRYHEIARATDFKAQPDVLIDYGVKLLKSNFDWAAQKWPQFNPVQHFKIASSAYNAGRGGAMRGVLAGDSDRYTTGGDYGLDVLGRMAIFRGILSESGPKGSV